MDGGDASVIFYALVYGHVEVASQRNHLSGSKKPTKGSTNQTVTTFLAKMKFFSLVICKIRTF